MWTTTLVSMYVSNRYQYDQTTIRWSNEMKCSSNLLTVYRDYRID